MQIYDAMTSKSFMSASMTENINPQAQSIWKASVEKVLRAL